MSNTPTIPTPEQRIDLARMIDDGDFRRDPMTGRIILESRRARLASEVVPGVAHALDIAITAIWQMPCSYLESVDFPTHHDRCVRCRTLYDLKVSRR